MNRRQYLDYRLSLVPRREVLRSARRLPSRAGRGLLKRYERGRRIRLGLGGRPVRYAAGEYRMPSTREHLQSHLTQHPHDAGGWRAFSDHLQEESGGDVTPHVADARVIADHVEHPDRDRFFEDGVVDPADVAHAPLSMAQRAHLWNVGGLGDSFHDHHGRSRGVRSVGSHWHGIAHDVFADGSTLAYDDEHAPHVGTAPGLADGILNDAWEGGGIESLDDDDEAFIRRHHPNAEHELEALRNGDAGF